MLSHEDVANLLMDAAKLLEEKGWVQGAYETPDGYCAYGALCSAAGARLSSAQCARQALREALNNWLDIHEWNDESGRTKQEVLDLFQLAAKNELRKGEQE